MNADARMHKARAALVLDQPFWANLALRMKLVPMPEWDAPSHARDAGPAGPKAATDGATLRYRPSFAAEAPMAEIIGVIAHEAAHVALQHHRRRGDRDPARWNLACDLAINPILQAAGLTLPETAVIDPTATGKAAEAIYTDLPAPDDDGDENDNGAPQDAAGAQAPGQAGQGDQPGQEGQDGDQEPDEAPPTDPGGCGAVEDAPEAPGSSEDRQAAAEERIAVAQAAAIATARGRMPGQLKAAIEPIIAPPLDWRALLAEFLDRAARDDYSWARPDSRYSHLGFILPSLTSESLDVAVALDSSGSTEAHWPRFATELRGMLASYPACTVTLIICDAEIQGTPQRYELADLPDRLPLSGGGGTSFAPPFEWVEAEGVEPAALVYLTDLYGTVPPVEPGYPVIWACTTDEIAPWGETIHLPPTR